MKLHVSNEELSERIRLNFERMRDGEYYTLEKVFSPSNYSWYGDKEGRSLLAFVSLYKITGEKIPTMDLMMNEIGARLNEDGYFGPLYSGKILEEQLSGHSWFLRGLCEYYEAFGDAFSLDTVRKIVENLYLPLRGRICSYPLERSATNLGGVSGEISGVIGDWVLSTDIGCAFMSIDGLSHAYKITGDVKIKELLDEMIDFYLDVDKIKLKAQTHCTLTAARGMIRMYSVTEEERYLSGAREIFRLYAYGGGMTKTYQNLNWWGREDSWTEPCAIVDSIMLATELYKYTDAHEYRTLAARIFHNGLATAQRANGGAGTDTLICDGSPYRCLAPEIFEAHFCCTMRISEGLWYINENRDLLWAEVTGSVTRNLDNTYSDGDIIYCLPDEELLPYAKEGKNIDGITLYPIVKGYAVPSEIFARTKQRIRFE